MKKRLFCILTALLLAFCLLPTALAAGTDSGACGEGLTWTLDEQGTLTVSGSGAMSASPDYLRLYAQQIRAAVIGDGVTGIGERAFADCTYLASVTMADSVTVIGDYAFQNCQRLKEASLSPGLVSIGRGAFYNCSRLPGISLPGTLAFIGQGAFLDCSRLNSVSYSGTETEWAAIDLGAENGRLAIDRVRFDGPAAPARAYDPDVSVSGVGVGWTDAVPFIDENGRTMVPLRAVGEALGLTVSWDGARREAGFSDGERSLFFPIGSRSARTGEGGRVEMDTAAVIAEGRTYAPVRYLAEYFGFTVTWDAPARTVRIG